MPIEIKIPEVGESVSEAFVQEWLKSEGDHVEKDETIAELETEKVSFELPSPAAGTLSRILKSKGDTAQVGEVIAHLDADDEGGVATSAATTKTEEREAEEAKKQAEPPPREVREKKKKKEEKKDERPHVPTGGEEEAEGRDERVAVEPRLMPGVERALADHDLRPEDVEATGPGGRLLYEDVARHVQDQKQREREKPDRRPPAAPPPAEPAPASRREARAMRAPEQREEELVAMTPMRRTIARRLVEAQQTAALLTTFNEADMTEVNALRRRYRDRFEQRYGVRLGFMSFFVKAAIDALKAFPAVNAEVRGHEIAYRNYYDIGVAVSTDRGLVVPVLRDADRMSFAQVESAVNDFARRARDGDLDMDDIRGGTFTITNGGVFGSLLSTPIVNPPQSGVLGMHAIQDRPVAVDGQVVIRPMMYLALTYDHRIVDGREAVSFLRRIKEAVEQPTRLLMEV